MKILLLSPNQIERYNWGHQLFRNEIGKHHDVIYYGDEFPNYNPDLTAPQILSYYSNVDLILTYGLRYTLQFKDIGKINNIKKGHIIVDLFPPHPAGYKGGMYDKAKPFLKDNNYDILFVRQKCQLEYLKMIGCDKPAYWLPFSVDTGIYIKQPVKKIYDTMTSATVRDDVYPNRRFINDIVTKMNINSLTKKVIRYEYVKAINQTKICIISVNCFASPNMKFTEYTSCGTFVLSDKPADMEDLGFKDREHLVVYKDMNDLQEKIRYYLDHSKEREQIAAKGMHFTRKTHNNIVRINKMFDDVNKEFGK